MSSTGIVLALLSALLFGASTPIARSQQVKSKMRFLPRPAGPKRSHGDGRNVAFQMAEVTTARNG